MKLKKKTTRPATRTTPHLTKSLSVPVEPKEVAAPNTSFFAEPEASSVAPAETGLGVGVAEEVDGEGLGELVELGVGDGETVGVGVGVGETVGEGDGGEAVGLGLAEGNGLESTARTDLATKKRRKKKKRNSLKKDGRKFILIID